MRHLRKNAVGNDRGNDYSSQVNLRPQWWQSASQAQKSRRLPHPGHTSELESIR